MLSLFQSIVEKDAAEVDGKKLEPKLLAMFVNTAPGISDLDALINGLNDSRISTKQNRFLVSSENLYGTQMFGP